jgi:hypothetical protein
MWEFVKHDGYYSVWRRSDGQLAFVDPMSDAAHVLSYVDQVYP